MSDSWPSKSGSSEHKFSWFRRLFFRGKAELRKPEVQDLFAKGERAVELQVLQKPQAAIDKDQALAVASLITSLDKTNDAIVQVGSILLVKSAGKLVTRTLTQKELIHIEQHPELLQRRDQILAALEACNGPDGPALPAKTV